MQKGFFVLALLITVVAARAQSPVQNIRGQIFDKQTLTELIGATVKVAGMNRGSVTDEDGRFKIDGVPVGRVSIEVSYLGYAPVFLDNLILSSGKELILTIEMEEQVLETQEVVVIAADDKINTNNDMTSVSARQFTIEETQRYAGARNDPARMASSFAGVQGTSDAVNDIVVRGNSPIGVLYRLEGIDIPNPNHFGDYSSTGGPVSMLNANVLSNSDFLTGAFPADYGNATSGVFDIRMRNGNDEQFEFLGQIGFNGVELGAEGPISRQKKSSFLVNYRYSTLGVFNALGIDFGTGTAIPYYQDLSFKLNFPSSKAGRFTVFGLGGLGHIDLVESTKDPGDDPDLYNQDPQDIRNKYYLGVIGMSHTYLFNNNTYGKLTLAASKTHNEVDVDSFDVEIREPADNFNNNQNTGKLELNYFISKKFNARHTIRGGVFTSALSYNLADSLYSNEQQRFVTLTSFEGNTYLLQPYALWQYRPTDRFTVNSGLHFLYLGLNNNYSVEPRLGVKYQLNEKQSLNAGYGLHGLMPQPEALFSTEDLPDGNVLRLNEDLAFVKSHQFVIGYDYNLNPKMRLRAEAYYQSIYNAITEQSPSSYSLLNYASFNFFIPDTLNNEGTGRNYGLELTAEHFLDRGFYFLGTASLFDSKYKGSDGILRNTAFNTNYIYNLLAGKDFDLNRHKTDARRKTVLAFDVKFTHSGGRRYTPVDEELTQQNGRLEYDQTRAFSLQYPDYLRLDVRGAFRQNGKKVTQEWAIDIQNVTNRKNPLTQDYNESTGEITTVYQLGLFPVVQYRIEF
jgi:hypothetical protein